MKGGSRIYSILAISKIDFVIMILLSNMLFFPLPKDRKVILNENGILAEDTLCEI